MTKLVRWTETAIECYKKGSSCKGCKISETIEQKCRMKTTVTELLKEFGDPKKEELKPNILEKKCSRCLQTKSIMSFQVVKGTYKSRCNECLNEIQRERRRAARVS